MLELQALAHSAIVSLVHSQAIGEQRAREAIELARGHGWEETVPSAATAYVALGSVMVWRGQLAEAEGWLDRAELVLQRFADPTTSLMLHVRRGLLESARGRHHDAMTAQRAAESIQRGLTTRHLLASRAQARTLEVLVHMGETGLVQRALDDMDEDVRATSALRIVEATLRLAEDDPEGAAAALAPIFDRALPIDNPRWEIQALVLKASAEDALGDAGASSRALERALDLTEVT